MNKDAQHNVNIPASVTTLGAHAFDNDDEIVSLYIPIAVVNVREQAFANATGLRKITFANE